MKMPLNLPLEREGGLRQKRDAMLAGTSHYPFTSSSHDLSVAKVRTILETCKVFRQFFVDWP